MGKDEEKLKDVLFLTEFQGDMAMSHKEFIENLNKNISVEMEYLEAHRLFKLITHAKFIPKWHYTWHVYCCLFVVLQIAVSIYFLIFYKWWAGLLLLLLSFLLWNLSRKYPTNTIIKYAIKNEEFYNFIEPKLILKKTNTHQTSKGDPDLDASIINSILATGDGSKERPYIVSAIQQEYLILNHFNKRPTLQAVLETEDGKLMDMITCEDETYYFKLK